MSVGALKKAKLAVENHNHLRGSLESSQIGANSKRPIPNQGLTRLEDEGRVMDWTRAATPNLESGF
jgi:hypothetical protein